MTNYLTTDTDLTAVADAIRTKGGTVAPLTFPQGFADAVAAISTGLSAENLITDETVWTPGFLNTTGTVSAPDANQREVTSELIAIPSGFTQLLFILEIPESTSAWNAYFLYDADRVRISGRKQVSWTSMNYGSRQFYYGFLSVDQTAAFIRVSFRTYGNAQVFLCGGNPLRELFLAEAKVPTVG